MAIQKYTDNLYASEVYRELERAAVRKGHFKPTEEQQIKIAAQQIQQKESINKPIDSTPSNDLVQDVARLAYAMRRKGYVTQADDLEQKLVMFKKAESALYDVTPEKNKDFIEFSHRDGDVEIIEGAGELGKIETIESAAEKIRALIRKEPTGKLPGKSASLEHIASIIRKADLGDMGVGESDVPQATKSTEEADLDAGTKSALSQAKQHLTQISNGFKQIQNVNFEDAMTTFLHGQGGKASVFNTLGGDYSQLDRYGAMVKAAYGQGAQSYETIQNTILKNPQGANQYLQNIGVNEQFANTAQKQPGWSSQQPQLTDEQKTLAQQIASRVDTQIKQQGQRAKAELDKVKTELDKRKKRALEVSQAIDQMAGWNTENLRDARNFYLRVKGSTGEIEGALSQIQWILNGFGMQNAVQSINQGLTLLKDSINTMGQKLRQVSGANIPHTHARLKAIRAKLQNILKKDKKNAKAEQTLDLVRSMIEAIKANQTQGEKAVLEAIPGGYSTWKDLDYDTVQLLEMVKKDAAGGE